MNKRGGSSPPKVQRQKSNSSDDSDSITRKQQNYILFGVVLLISIWLLGIQIPQDLPQNAMNQTKRFQIKHNHQKNESALTFAQKLEVTNVLAAELNIPCLSMVTPLRQDRSFSPKTRLRISRSWTSRHIKTHIQSFKCLTNTLEIAPLSQVSDVSLYINITNSFR